MRIRAFAPALTLAALLSGCGSDDPTGPDGGGTERSVKDNPSFASDVQEIVNRRGCASGSCHGSSQSAGLDLRTGNSFASLVGVTSTQEPSRTRVVAGDADNSYLVIKLEGRQSVGARMPLGGTPLDNTDLTNIKNWINRGANNN